MGDGEIQIKRIELPKSTAFAQTTLAEGLSAAALIDLAENTQERVFKPGQIIAREGELIEEIYVIGVGKAEVVAGYGTPQACVLAVLETRDVAGEMSFVERTPRPATVAAAEFTRVYVLPWATIDGFREKFPADHAAIMLNIARELSRRLRTLDRAFAAKSF